MAAEAQQAQEQSPQAQSPAVAPVPLLAPSSASAFVSRVLSLQATAGNRATTEAILRLRSGERAIARAPGQKPKAEPVVIEADTFDGAASAFHRFLAANRLAGPARMIIVNGVRIHVYDEKGDPVGPKKGFRLTHEVALTAGVFGEFPDRRLHAVLRLPDGRLEFGGVLGASVDFAKDVDDGANFGKSIAGGTSYYVFPTARLQTDVKPPDPQDLPEFMQFEAAKPANLKAWDATVSPLTPQIATVGSKGSYRCDVHKNVGQGLLDRTTNLMEPTSFRWEVLKLDQSLKVTDKSHATRWKGLKANFAQREKHLQGDKETWLGDHRDRQGSLEKAARRVAADQITDARRVLAMSGEVAMTFVHALVGDTKTPNIVDYIDVPWSEPGDYFVRCLATPMNQESQKNKKAGDLGGRPDGVGVRPSRPGGEQPAVARGREDRRRGERQGARSQAIGAGRPGQDEGHERGGDPGAADAIDLAFEQAKGKAAGNTEQTKAAELAHVQAQIDYMSATSFPKDAKLKWRSRSCCRGSRRRPRRSRPRWTRPRNLVAHAITRWNDARGPDRRGHGRAAGPDVRPRRAHVRQRRRARGAGRRRHGRHWAAVQRPRRGPDEGLARRRGRRRCSTCARTSDAAGAGWPTARPRSIRASRSTCPTRCSCGWRRSTSCTRRSTTRPTPPRWSPWSRRRSREGRRSARSRSSAPSRRPAAPTGSSTARWAPWTWHWDEGAVMDLVNIATLGLGKVGQIKAAGRGLQIVASGSNIAVKVFDKGQLLWMTMQTFQALTAPVPGEDEREGRRRRLLKLLEFAQAASIPVTESLFPAGTRPHGKTGAPDSAPADGRG